MAVATANMSEEIRQKRAQELLRHHSDTIFRALVQVSVNPYKHLLRKPMINWTDDDYNCIAIFADIFNEDLKPRRCKETYFNNAKYGILDGMKFLGLLPCSREEQWYNDYTQVENPLFQRYNPQYTDPNLTIEQQPGYNPNPLNLFQ